jgi:hypothetical protein
MPKQTRKTFTLAELSTLRAQFAGIKTVQPERLADFRRIFDGCHNEAILQLTAANINFVSRLAINEKARRGL